MPAFDGLLATSAGSRPGPWAIEPLLWREEAEGDFGPHRGHEAVVGRPDRRLRLPRLVGESHWVTDTAFGPDQQGGLPVSRWVHEFGSLTTARYEAAQQTAGMAHGAKAQSSSHTRDDP